MRIRQLGSGTASTMCRSNGHFFQKFMMVDLANLPVQTVADRFPRKESADQLLVKWDFGC
jgi:hypothetical protein